MRFDPDTAAPSVPSFTGTIPQAQEVSLAAGSRNEAYEAQEAVKLLRPHGFQLVQCQEIKELGGTASLYRHARTGLEVFFVRNQDPVLTFGISFWTPPVLVEEDESQGVGYQGSSRGLPHCAEHWVLCGSHNIPCRKPFLEYSKASVALSFNAATDLDYTTFFVSSPNATDVSLAIPIFLDGCFDALLEDDSFQKDIWRLESAAGRARLNGALLNEMKGAASDPFESHATAVMQHLLPDTIYRYNSGGEPSEIPDLAPEQVRAFVRCFYHPSNAKAVIYGKEPPELTLALLEKAIERFEYRRLPAVPTEQPFPDAPKSVIAYYPGGQTEDASRDTIISVNFNLGAIPDLRSQIELEVLEEIFLELPESPLKRALTDSGYGEAVLDSMYSGVPPNMIASLGVSGAAASDTKEIEGIIVGELQRLAEQGFTPELVDRALDAQEFEYFQDRTEPEYGEEIMFRTFEGWLHGEDPFSMHLYDEAFEALRADIRAGKPVFQDLIKRLFLDNRSRLTLTLRPQRSLISNWDKAEERRIQKMLAEGDQPIPADKLEVSASERGLAALPRLKVTDIDRQAKQPPLHERYSSERAFCYEVPMHGIVSMDLAWSFRHVPQELLPYVAVLSQTLLELNQKPLKKFHGDFGAYLSIAQNHQHSDFTALFSLGGTFTTKRAVASAETIRSWLLDRDLDDQKRFVREVLECKAQLENDIQGDGLDLAARRAAAKLDPAQRIEDCMQGVAYLQFLRKLVPEARRNWPRVLEKLQEVRELIVKFGTPKLRLAGDSASLEKAAPPILDLLAGLPNEQAPQPAWSLPSLPDHEGFRLPAQVNHIAQAFDLRCAGWEHHGAIHFITNHLEHVYLWQSLRDFGGAYTPSIEYHRESGLLIMGTGRDINLLQTLDIFRGVPDWLRSGILTQEEELRRSKIGALGGLDCPMSADDWTWSDFIERVRGVPHDFLQNERRQIFTSAGEEAAQFAAILEKSFENLCPVVVVGPKQALEEANRARGSEWLEITVLE